MLVLYLKFFLLFGSCILLSFMWSISSLLVLVLHSELFIIVLFCIFLLLSITYNINFLIGLAICYLIIGSLELSLSLLLLMY